ncbi:hypothetical protein AAG906_027071 [Vitis piasezkii]
MAKSPKLHIAMFPWFAFGHMIPYLNLSNELAGRGHKITFVLPRKAQSKLQHLNFHPALITFHPLIVPHVDGLPPGTETASDIPVSLTCLLATALDRTRDQVEAALLPMLQYSLCTSHCPHPCPSLQLAETGQSQLSHPWLPLLKASFGERLTFHECIITAMKHCNAISIRICQEIEGPFCDYAASQYAKPVFLTGQVLPEPITAKWKEALTSPSFMSNYVDKFVGQLQEF